MRQSCCRCAGKCFGCNSVANGCSSNCGNMVACGWRSCNIKMPHCRVSKAMQTLYKITDAILCIAAKQRRATRGCFLPNGSFHKAIAPGEPTPQGVYWLHDDSISSCVCLQCSPWRSPSAWCPCKESGRARCGSCTSRGATGAPGIASAAYASLRWTRSSSSIWPHTACSMCVEWVRFSQCSTEFTFFLSHIHFLPFQSQLYSMSAICWPPISSCSWRVNGPHWCSTGPRWSSSCPATITGRSVSSCRVASGRSPTCCWCCHWVE